MNGRRIAKRVVASVAVVAAMSLTASPGHARHALEAEHVPFAVAVEGEPLHVRVEVATTCAIAYCSWLVATVRYEGPGGEQRSVTAEGPYQAFQVLTATVPAEHITGPWLRYRISVWQQDCLGDCHVHEVSLPRVASGYEVVIIDA